MKNNKKIKNKVLIFSSLAVLCFSSVFSLVFGSNIIFFPSIGEIKILSKNIFLNSENLDNTLIIVTSDSDISDYNFHSLCHINSKFLGRKSKSYYFKVDFLSVDCNRGDLFLRNEENTIINSNIKLNIAPYSKLFSIFIDYSDDDLYRFRKILSNNIKKYSLFKNYDETKGLGYYNFLKKNRVYNELVYKKVVLDSLLLSREKKYISPVKGYKIGKHSSKIPNASRGYRKGYTDGVHHGWDIDAPIDSPVIALDDSVIIRIVSNFDYSDLLKIKYDGKLSYEEKLRNLDLLRGNQIWLKTSAGDVVFYSHLSKVYTDIKEGMFVKRGYPLGTIGISGVPDKNYKDYHLHFAIQKNPYDKDKAGKYDIEDYMKWDWYFIGKNREYILKNIGKVFEIN